MTLLLLSALSAADPDLGDWTKPEGTLPVETPVVSCCGFDRATWRQLAEERREAVADCVSGPPAAPLRLAITLEVDGESGEVRALVDSSEPVVSACVEAAWEGAHWPGEPLGCSFRVTWPAVVVPPDHDATTADPGHDATPSPAAPEGDR